MSDTPQTDDLARGNHVVPTEWAEQLERERDEAREKAERYRIDANALMMQRDEALEIIRKAKTAFCKDGADGKIAAEMFHILVSLKNEN